MHLAVLLEVHAIRVDFLDGCGSDKLCTVGFQTFNEQLLYCRMVLNSNRISHLDDCDVIAVFAHEVSRLSAVQATAEHEYLRSRSHFAHEDILVGQAACLAKSRNSARHKRYAAGGKNEDIRFIFIDHFAVSFSIVEHLDAVLLAHIGIVGDGTRELLLVRGNAGLAELAARHGISVDEAYGVTACCGCPCSVKTCKAGADDHHFLALCSRLDLHGRLSHGERVDHASAENAAVAVIVIAALQTSDTRSDLLLETGSCLVHELRICK